jgi:hypothetical protein
MEERLYGTSEGLEEEEGLQGVFKRLRRNRHQLEKDAASSSAQTFTTEGLAVTAAAGAKQRYGGSWCRQWGVPHIKLA